MDKELQQALAAMLNKTVSGIEAGAQFLQEQLPEVIQQLLLWKAVESGVVFSAFLIATFLSAYCTRRFWLWVSEDDSGGEPFVLVPITLTGLLLLGACKSLEWLQILIAPKVYLIEYAASLTK